MKLFLRFLLAFALCLATPVRADLTVNNLIGFGVGGSAPPASVSFVGCTADTGNNTTYTFTNHATGTAGNRWTIVGIGGRDGTTDWSWSSATIGGTNAPEVVDSYNAASVSDAAIYILANPTGTTSTITVTASEAIAAAIVCVWAAYDLTSATAYATNSAFDTAAGALTLSLNVPSGGIAVGVAAAQVDSVTHTWTGLTERSDQGSGDAEVAVSSADSTTVGTPLAVTVDASGSNDSNGATASFR